MDDRATLEDLRARLAALEGENARLRAAVEAASPQGQGPLLHAILGAVPALLALLDDAGRVQQLGGTGPHADVGGEAIGAPLSALPIWAEPAAVEALLDEARRQAPVRRDLALRRPEGPDGCLDTTVTRLPDRGDAPGGFVVHAVDVTADRAMARAHRTSETRLAQAQRIAHVGHWAWEIDSGELTWSDETFRIFGHAPQSFEPTYARFLDQVVPDDRPRLEAAVQRSLDAGTPYSFTHALVRPDGTRRIVREQGEVEIQDGQPRRMVGTVLDITELARTEAELRQAADDKDALLREVHHRVRNNLQVVTSLLYLQARGLEHADARNALVDARARVQSMALAHETIYQSERVGSVDMGRYVRRITEALLQLWSSPGVAVETAITVDRLPLGRAVPVALLITELVTNALKYAFPDDRAGTVAIAFARRGDVLVLSVRDDGIGLPESARTSTASLGLQLVRILTEQLQGELSIDTQPGTTFEVVFPDPA